MKLSVFLFCVLSAVTNISHADDSVRSAEVGAKKTKDQIYLFGRCSFQIHDLAGGLFASEGGSGAYTYLELKKGIDIEAGFRCLTQASPDGIDEQLDSKYVNGQWIWSATNQPFEAAQHFHSYIFAGKNWKGRGNTYDDTIGEEARRQRRFNFCLVQTAGPQVLCVNTPVMALDSPKSNVLPKIMAVLRSIEFISPPIPAGAGAASLVTEPNQ